MASPVSDSYSAASGQAIYGGRIAPIPGGGTDNAYVGFLGTFVAVPAPTAGAGGGTPESFGTGADSYVNKPFQLELHGSSGANYTTGWRYSVPVSGRMAYPGYPTCDFSLVAGNDGTNRVVKMRPIDVYGLYPGNGQWRESFFGGLWHVNGSNDMTMTTVRQLDAEMHMAFAEFADQYDMTRTSVAGGSMGADACFRYGIRRPQFFAAVFSDRGRWRYAAPGTKMMVPDWTSNIQYMEASAQPNIAAEDGGGSHRDWCDGIAYITNTTKRVPFIGWGMGTADANYTMADHNAALVAMRARKFPHCFVWSAAGHETSVLPRIYASYPPMLFQLGKSLPYFSEHSLDKNPLVDAAGGINEGLTWDPASVIDTASKWECRVKHISAACTVKVEPCYPVNFPAGAQAQLVTLPANTWVTVTFNA